MINNIPSLEDTGKGLTLKLGGRYLASPYAPKEKAEKIAQRSCLIDKCIYIIPSPLFAYGLDILIAKLPENSYILCIEQDQNVMKLSSQHFPATLLDNKQIDYIRSNDISQIVEFLREKGLGLYRKCDLLLLNGLNPDRLFYQSLQTELRNQLNSYWKNRITMIELGNRWISNILHNMNTIDKALPFPKTDKPLIICGAGASLSTNFNEIKTHRDSYFILAVDTAVPALRESGILPDAIVNLDGQFYNSLDFYHCNENVIRLCDMTAYPSTLRKGSCSLFLSKFCESDFLKTLEKTLGVYSIPAMGSVGVSAFELSCMITKGPIILCGLDFAYIPGASHVKGSIFHQHYLYKHNRLSCDAGVLARVFRKKTIKLPENYLYTDPLLQSYHKDLMSFVEKSGRTVYKWNQYGLSMDLKEWNPEEHQDLLQNRMSKSDSEQEYTQIKHPEQKEFLMNEWKKCLYNILKLWDSYQKNIDYQDELLTAMKSADFLYLGSPFSPPEPSGEPEVLTLLIMRCRKLLELLNHLQQD